MQKSLVKNRGVARFTGLDGLRGLAALAVFGAHVPDPLLRDALPGCDLAVDLFFALSGFVLAHAYFERLRKGMGVGTFFKRRVIRLYPLYALGTIISLSIVRRLRS